MSTGFGATSQYQFPYRQVPYIPGLAPAVRVQFVALDGSLSRAENALIDTGCDQTTFPMQWINRLGIDRSACRPNYARTATGHDAELQEPQALEWVDGVDVVLCERRLRVAAVFRLNREMPILLGRDLLDHFELCVDHRRRGLWLTPYSPADLATAPSRPRFRDFMRQWWEARGAHTSP